MIPRVTPTKEVKDNTAFGQEYVDEDGKTIAPIPIYSFDEKIVLSFSVDKNIVVNLYDTTQGYFVEFRKCWKGSPTKSFMKIPFIAYEKIYNIIKDKEKNS